MCLPAYYTQGDVQMETWTNKDGKQITTNRSRPHRVSVRLSDDEYAQLQEHVAASGLTQQEFIIKAISNKKISITNTEGIKELVPELKRLGNNLNQVAKALNGTKYYSYNLITENQKELAELWQLLRQYLRK